MSGGRGQAGEGGGRQELQALSQQLQEVQSSIEALQSEVQALRAQKTEIDEAIDALGTLESGSVVQVPLGGDAYVRAEVQDIDEVIVGLGGGYAAERTESDAVEILESKQDTLDDRIADLNESIAELQSEGQQLEQRAQQLQQRQLQQLQQGQGSQRSDE